MKRVRKLKFIDLFAGAGGLSCGLEQAGLKCILGVDHNKHAMETFALNHKHAKTFCGPIQDLTNKKLKDYIGENEVHIVVGGPPCQGFSTVGPGNPNDVRNALFLEFVRVVKYTRPLFVVLENVTGLLAKKNEKTLSNIFKKFEKLGYKMDAKVLHSHHYGVAEKRRRTIIIGSRFHHVPLEFPPQIYDRIVGNAFLPPITVGEVLKSLKTDTNEILNHDLTNSRPKTKLDLQRIKKIPEGKGIRYKQDEDLYFTKKLKLDIDWKTIREGRLRQTKYFRLDSKKPAPTIMTHRHTYFHPVQNRYLTQREAAAIQSFPNDFEFIGPLSAQWRQIGNAVPPLMAKAIGMTLKRMYGQSFKNKTTDKRKKLQKNIKEIRSKAFTYR